MRRSAVLLALWLGVAMLAMAGGTWAVSLAGSASGQPQLRVLSPDQIRQALREDDAAAAIPGAGGAHTDTPSVSPTGGPVPHGLTTPGGTVVAICPDGDRTVVLDSWSPAPGYRADHVERGPAPTASLEFESEVVDDVEVTVTCRGGVPVATSASRPDDHGHDRGDDSG